MARINGSGFKMKGFTPFTKKQENPAFKGFFGNIGKGLKNFGKAALLGPLAGLKGVLGGRGGDDGSDGGAASGQLMHMGSIGGVSPEDKLGKLGMGEGALAKKRKKYK